MAGTPNAAVTQIMTTTDAKILPIPAETVEALKVNYPWYASYTIPAGTYAGQEEDVPTSAVKLTLFITADVDEETVYQMTKTFWESWDMLTETHAALRKASLESACTDLAVCRFMMARHATTARSACWNNALRIDVHPSRYAAGGTCGLCNSASP